MGEDYKGVQRLYLPDWLLSTDTPE